MVGKKFTADTQPGEHHAGGAGVFTGDEVDGAENGPGPFRQVGEVADRCGHDIKVAGLGDERSIIHRWGKEATRRRP
jgi:hypothetical protein